ncbi:MAG: tetratricopeptide repeat protein, partial [Paracoccaceae bacterium]
RTSIELGLTTPLPQVDSHALFMSAVAGIHQHYWPTFAKARDYLEELCARLPDHSVLHAWLAKWHIIAIAQGWSSDHARDFETAYARSSTALEVNPTCPTALTIDGFVRGTRIGEMQISQNRFQSALGLDPNNALGWLMYSRMQSYLGHGPEAVQMAQKARRLSPVDPYAYFFDIMEAMAQLVNGDAVSALDLAKSSIQTNPRHSSSFRVLAMAQARLGQLQEARQTVTRLLHLEPDLTVSHYLAGHPAGDQPIVRETADLLSQAGVPH